MYWYYGAACGEGDGYGGAYKYSTDSYNGWVSNLPNQNIKKNNGASGGYASTGMSGRYSTGDTSSASSLPPYITCYRWTRVA